MFSSSHAPSRASTETACGAYQSREDYHCEGSWVINESIGFPTTDSDLIYGSYTLGALPGVLEDHSTSSKTSLGWRKAVLPVHKVFQYSYGSFIGLDCETNSLWLIIVLDRIPHLAGATRSGTRSDKEIDRRQGFPDGVMGELTSNI